MGSKTSDLKEYRKKKKRKKTFKRVFFSCILIALTVLLFAFRDNWMPWLEDTVDNVKYEVFKGNKDKDKNFPLNLTSSSSYCEKALDNKIAIITDTYYNVYDSNGRSCFSDQHAMSNPVLKTSDKKALIYDQGAKKYIVESRFKRIYSKTLDENIMYANISSKGYVAVVTASNKYSSLLTVYDEDGKKMFYASNSEKILSLDFTDDSKGCIVSTMSSAGGQMVTKLTRYNFSVDKSIWTTEGINTLGMSVNVTDDNGCILVGDDKAVFFDSDGKVTDTYVYDSEIKSFCVSGNSLVVYLLNEDLRKHTVKIVSGKNVVSVDIAGNVNNIYLNGSSLYVLTESKLSKYSSKGTLLREKTLTGTYDQLVEIKGYVYLVGHEILDKIYVGT